jgi:MarR family transcriptional regulator, transcriptional regulator for hemolysin
MLRDEDLTRNYGFLLSDVARMLRHAYDRRVRDLGLTRSQWWVLNQLFRNPGVNQSELAEILEIRKPTLGRLLDRMEAKGWVRREQDASDRRAWRVHLTDAVQPAMRELRKAAADLRRDALAGVNASQRDQFIDTLLTIKANLAKMK